MLYVALGGIIPILLIALLVGRIFLKNMETKKKILVSTSIAYVLGLVISGFGNANGGAFAPLYFEYLLSSVFVICLRFALLGIRGNKQTQD